MLLFRDSGVPVEHAHQTAAWFTKVPGPITVEVTDAPVDIAPTPLGWLRWDDLFGRLRDLRAGLGGATEPFLILLTSLPNELNWFSAQDDSCLRNGFGHVDDFRWVTTAPPPVISAHYVVKSVLNAVVTERGVPWHTLWHQEPRGCVFDFCAAKAELHLKLRTADICGDCMEAFRRAGLPDELLRQVARMMEAQRRHALNTAPFLDDEPAFSRWPFPLAVTRHKAAQARRPLLRFHCLLDHFDSLVRFAHLLAEVTAGRRPQIPDRPSLGWWVEQLAARAEEHGLQEVLRVAESQRLVHLRNERRGHGWTALAEDAYANEITTLEAALSRIEEAIRPFLDGYQVVVLRDLRLEDSRFVLEGDLLEGSNMLHPPFRRELQDDPRGLGIASLGQVYVTARAQPNRFWPFSPYMRDGVCPECRTPRVMITDGAQYIDVVMGHRVAVP